MSSQPPVGWRHVLRFVLAVGVVVFLMLQFGEHYSRWARRSIQSIQSAGHSTGISNASDLWMGVNTSVNSEEGSDAATAVNDEKEHHEKQTQHTLLLAVLEVSWSRWTFAMNQISYAFETCNDSRFSLQCIAITNNESLYKFAYKSSRNKSVPHRCPLHFADGKAATQIISFNVKDISVDYVGIMLADTNLRPHRASSRIESNVHFPIFIETMQRMKYDSAMPSIVNQNYLPYQRPRPSCQARSALFGDPQLIVYDSVKFRCFQSHIRHHISYHREISTFAALFYSACNASVGIMDQHHTGHAFINTQI